MRTAFIVKVNQAPVAICKLPQLVTDGNKFTLEQLQEAVGGYIAIIPLGGGKTCMVVDEEGMCKDKEINSFASTIAGQPIVGNVVLCRTKDID